MPRAARKLKTDAVLVDPLAPKPAEEPKLTVVRPAPEAELTPEQKRIRDLEDLLAKERGRKDVDPEFDTTSLGENGNVIIHFLEDGLTALGQVWYRGQELEFAPDSRAYRDTLDRTGRSWLDLRHDEAAQSDRWGKVMFRPGPWPGKSLLDVASVPFDVSKPLKPGAGLVPTEEELAEAQKAEARRRRAAPHLPPV